MTTVSTLTPETTRFKAFLSHSLVGKGAEALRMTTKFYSALRVRISGYLFPRPLYAARLLCLDIEDANIFQYQFQGCILPEPAPVIFGVLFQRALFGGTNHPVRFRALHGSNPALKCYWSPSERSRKLVRLHFQFDTQKTEDSGPNRTPASRNLPSFSLYKKKLQTFKFTEL